MYNPQMHRTAYAAGDLHVGSLVGDIQCNISQQKNHERSRVFFLRDEVGSPQDYKKEGKL